MPASVHAYIAAAGVSAYPILLEATADILGFAFKAYPHSVLDIIRDRSPVELQRRNNLHYALLVEFATLAPWPQYQRKVVHRCRREGEAVFGRFEPCRIGYCRALDGRLGSIQE